MSKHYLIPICFDLIRMLYIKLCTGMDGKLSRVIPHPRYLPILSCPLGRARPDTLWLVTGTAEQCRLLLIPVLYLLPVPVPSSFPFHLG